MSAYGMVNLKRTPREKVEDMMPMAYEPSDTPPGLCLCLTETELEKLGLSDDVDMGDLLHLRLMCEVTAVHKTENGCRIELAAIHGTVEDEDDEGDEEDE